VQSADHARSVRELLGVEVEFTVRRRVAIVDLQLTIQSLCARASLITVSFHGD